MSVTSPVKKKAYRFQDFLVEAKKQLAVKWNVENVSDQMIADKLGISGSSFSGIKNGNANMSRLDKAARDIADMLDGTINAGYVINNDKKLIVRKKKVEDVLDELPDVDMDDELDDLEDVDGVEIVDDEFEDVKAIGNSQQQAECTVSSDTSDDTKQATSQNVKPQTDKPKMDVLNTEMSVAQARIQQLKVDNKSTYTPRTAKDKWADAAIEIGVKDVDDDIMQYFSKTDNKLHVFKSAQGTLPYRQEIFDIQAVGFGKPQVINYYDDKCKFRTKFVIVADAEVTLEASSKDEVKSMILKMVEQSRIMVGSSRMHVVDVLSDSVIVKD